MPEFGEMRQCLSRGGLVVDDDVGDARQFAVPGHDDRRQGQSVLDRRVDENQPLDGALGEELQVIVEEVGLRVMSGDQVEVALLQELVLDASEDAGRVALADLRQKDADRERPLPPKRACDEVRAVAEFFRRGADSLLGLRGDPLGGRRAVHHQGNGGRRQAQMGCNVLESDGFTGVGLVPRGAGSSGRAHLPSLSPAGACCGTRAGSKKVGRFTGS